MTHEMHRLEKLAPPKVMIGIPVGGDIVGSTVSSLFETQKAAAKVGMQLELSIQKAVHVLSRDAIVADFMDSDCDMLFWIDSDVTWAPESFMRLCALAMTYGIVCGAYPAKKDGPKPTFYLDFNPGEIVSNPHGLVPIYGIGLGFSCIARAPLIQLAETKPAITDQLTHRTQRAIFRFDLVDGHRRTEDMAFFADLRELGHTVWLDPHVTLGHIGQKQWDGRFLDLLIPAPLTEVAAA